MRVSQETRDKAVDYSLESIRYVCEDIGARESGSENELKSQEWMKAQLLDNGWADEAEIEEFTVSRHALVGFTKIVSVMLLLSVVLDVLAFVLPEFSNTFLILSVIMPVVALVMTVCEFLLYKEFVDPILPKSKSHNVYARYKSEGETTKRIVFSGHCDSAYEWTLMKIAPAFMIVVLAANIVGALAAVVILAMSLVAGAVETWALIALAVFAPFYFLLFFMCNFKHVVPGANDNLTGALAAMSVLKCLKEEGIRFEHTEVAALLTGSEEAGLRGARHWAKTHKKEIEESNIDTVFVSLETFRDWDYFSIYTRDMTMTVGHDKGVIKLLEKATKACGRDIPKGMVFFGASDAAAVSEQGLRASCLAAMDPKPAPYYHNRKDTPDNMDRKSYAYGLDCAIAAAEIFDLEGANE